MKSLFVIIAISLLSMASAQAAGHIGQCAAPKTKVAKNGYLEFKTPVNIYDTPEEANSKGVLKRASSSFIVAKEAKGFIQLQEIPDGNTNSNSGKVIGWGKASNFDFVALRNCS